MSEHVYFDDVEEGMSLPALRKAVTLRDHLRYHVISGATGPIHIDVDYARSTGLPDVVLCGHMRIAHLAQLLTDWMGESGTLRRIGARQKGFDTPNRPLVAQARITRKYNDGSDALLDLDVWIENDKGERTCEGTATIALQIRPASAIRQ